MPNAGFLRGMEGLVSGLNVGVNSYYQGVESRKKREQAAAQANTADLNASMNQVQIVLSATAKMNAPQRGSYLKRYNEELGPEYAQGGKFEPAGDIFRTLQTADDKKAKDIAGRFKRLSDLQKSGGDWGIELGAMETMGYITSSAADGVRQRAGLKSKAAGQKEFERLNSPGGNLSFNPDAGINDLVAGMGGGGSPMLMKGLMAPKLSEMSDQQMRAKNVIAAKQGGLPSSAPPYVRRDAPQSTFEGYLTQEQQAGRMTMEEANEHLAVRKKATATKPAGGAKKEAYKALDWMMKLLKKDLPDGLTVEGFEVLEKREDLAEVITMIEAALQKNPDFIEDWNKHMKTVVPGYGGYQASTTRQLTKPDAKIDMAIDDAMKRYKAK